jgi:hypothetical protein
MISQAGAVPTSSTDCDLNIPHIITVDITSTGAGSFHGNMPIPIWILSRALFCWVDGGNLID